MTERMTLYDELCRVLTDYEGNGSEESAEAGDLYGMLVKIQNLWEDVITADSSPDSEPRSVLSGWLTGAGPVEYERNGYHFTLIKVRKNADFDYLYLQRQYHGKGIERDDKFEYAGVFCRRDGQLYDGQYAIRDLVDEPDELRAREAEALHKRLETAVRKTVETAIGNDRDNLRITELSAERELEKLERFKEYSAGEQARKAYLDSDDEEDNDAVFHFTYQCDYSPERWTEDSLLAYILDPYGYVNAETDAYIDSRQEAILSDFLESDMVAAAYAAIIENPANPVHRVKRIMRAVSASSAKTVTVTVRKDGAEFTFKAEAGQYRSDCTNTYNDWHIAAADRKEFERIFGRGIKYGPEDIIRIEYARSVLYERDGVVAS